MALSESDLQLLDSYLDDELPSQESEALRRRLSSEPELAEAMDQVRFERDARQQFFQALDPGAAEIARLNNAVHRAVGREIIWTRRARALRMVSGIAACLLIGFSGGYIFRGRPAIPGQPLADNVQNRQIYFPDKVGGVPNVTRNSPNTGNSQFAGYEVKLTDEAGNVIATQRFPTIEQARDFANGVNHWRKENNQLRNGGVRLVGDQQF